PRFLGELVVRVQLRTDGQVAGDDVDQYVHLLPGDGRDRHDLVDVQQLVHGQQMLGQAVAADEIRLGDDGDHARAAPAGAHLGEVLGDEAVAGADLLVGGQAETDHVDLGERLAHQVVQPLPQQGAGTVHPGGVHQDDLGVLPGDDPADGAP